MTHSQSSREREGPELETVLDDLHDASNDPSCREAARMVIRFPEYGNEIVEHAQAWFVMRTWELVNGTRKAIPQ